MNAPAPLEGSAALVTGATGFIGSHLVDALLERGCAVHCLVRPTSDLKWLPVDRIHLHTGDLMRPDTWGNALEVVQHVFHCAGLTKARTRREYFEANATACEPLLDACSRRAGQLQSVVHLSSLAAVGPAEPETPVDETTPCHPVTYYGQSKRAGEEIVLRYTDTLPVMVLRPPVVYGPREQNFFTYLKTLKQGWAIRIGTEERTLSLVHVYDLVRAMLRAAEHPHRKDPVYFTTDGQVYSWEDVARTASRLLGVTPRTVTLPESALAFGALLSEGLSWFRSQPALLDRQRVLDIRQSAWTASSNKFFETYSFQPEYLLERGLQVTLDWYREQGWL